MRSSGARCAWTRVGAALIAACAAGAVSASGSAAQAAEVHLTAPDGCAEADAVVEQVETLLGRPLASVDGVDFDVAIARSAPPRWRLLLTTIDRSAGERRTRQIDGVGCSELSEAAAV